MLSESRLGLVWPAPPEGRPPAEWERNSVRALQDLVSSPLCEPVSAISLFIQILNENTNNRSRMSKVKVVDRSYV